MPKVKSLSEFNRNQSSIIEELHRTGEPLYLTRNGSSSVVVVDSDAFDEMMSFKRRIYAREMKVYEGLLAGYEDCQHGRMMSADEADALIRERKGWQ